MNRQVACWMLGCASLSGCGTALMTPVATQSQDPSRFSHTRLYCTPDDESHFETVTTGLGKVDAAPPAPPIFVRANAASRISFVGFDPFWGKADLEARKFHPSPSAQFVLYLQGVMSITATDGETRRFGPGDVLRVEDTAPCKGHISVVGDRASFAAISR